MLGTALVIGYGNSLRGDDALGLVVAQRLDDLLNCDRVQVLARPLLAPDLAENLAAVDLAIFIDASSHGDSRRITCRKIDADAGSASSMTHHCTPGKLLALADVLYPRLPTTYLITCRGNSFEFGQSTLTPAVQAAVLPIVDRTCELIEQELGICLGR